MTLNQFEEHMKTRMGFFVQKWKEEISKNSEDWPNEMNLADWLEQFEMIEGA